MATIGLLGTGRMGSAMARALCAAGHDLVVWNRSPESAIRLAAELGGEAVERPCDVARAAGVCISMLADGSAVDAVYGGPDGLIAGSGPANVLVDFIDRPAGDDPGPRGRRPRGRRRDPRRPGLGQRHSRRRRQADADGRR